MSDNEGKRPVWRPTQSFPMPEPMNDLQPSPPPVARWVARLGQALGLIVLLLIASLLVAPLVWAARQAWGWALG